MKVLSGASRRIGPLALVVLIAGCGGSGPAIASATPRPPAASTATSPSAVTAPSAVNPASTPAPQPAATAAPPAVADFRIVAYQGDAAFGGHDGHFAAAFALDKPVVLLYFGGL